MLKLRQTPYGTKMETHFRLKKDAIAGGADTTNIETYCYACKWNLQTFLLHFPCNPHSFLDDIMLVDCFAKYCMVGSMETQRVG